MCSDLTLRLGDSLGFRSVGSTGSGRSRGVPVAEWAMGGCGPANLFLEVQRNGGECLGIYFFVS